MTNHRDFQFFTTWPASAPTRVSDAAQHASVRHARCGDAQHKPCFRSKPHLSGCESARRRPPARPPPHRRTRAPPSAKRAAHTHAQERESPDQLLRAGARRARTAKQKFGAPATTTRAPSTPGRIWERAARANVVSVVNESQAKHKTTPFVARASERASTRATSTKRDSAATAKKRRKRQQQPSARAHSAAVAPRLRQHDSLSGAHVS